MSEKKIVPFYGIDRFFKQHAENLSKIFVDIGSSGKMLMGKEVSILEKELALFCSRKYAVSVSSCTDALFFALLSANVKPGDEVIVPSFSFIASVTPVLHAGAIPVFVDVLPETFSIDVEDIKRKTTAKTKAIIFVHLYGAYCPIKEIAEFAKENNIFLIEDNAQSFGANSTENIKAGTHGKITCLSFDPTKVIGGFGTAGVLLTDENSIYEYVNKLRYQGKNMHNGEFDVLGYNSRISTLQAALLSYQLNIINILIKKRQRIAHYYNSEFNNLEGVNYIQKDLRSTFHKYVIQTPLRDELQVFLKSKGIQTMIHYDKALFEHSLFKFHNHEAVNIKNVHKVKQTVLSLPIYPEMTDTEVEYVAECFKVFFK